MPESEFVLDVFAPGDDTFESGLLRVYEEMLEQETSDEAISDVDLSARLAQRFARFTLQVQASNYDEAVARALAFVRSAFHGAGASTPGWEHHSWIGVEDGISDPVVA